MKTLMVLRHAKSDWNADYGSDHDRPLNQRGLRAAEWVGHAVVDLGLVPDLIISSTAARARTTAELAKEAGGWDSDLVLDPGLYDTWVDGALAVIASAPNVGRIMVVGHQPTWGALVHRLTGAPADIRTATLAVIDLDIETWDEVDGASGRLVGIHHPR